MTDDRHPADSKIEHDVEEMEDSSQRVDEHIEDAKRDWEAKQNDSNVPGAVTAPDEERDEPAQAAQSEHGEAADRAGQ